MSVGTEIAKLGPLPEWDLADLYPGRDSAELKRAIAAAETDAAAFRARYEGKLAGLAGGALAEAITAFEHIEDVLGRLMSYAYLDYCTAMTDPETGRFFQNMQEKVNAISTVLLFFTLEINRIEEQALAEKLKDPALAHYAPWLRDTRAFRPHQLSDELEKLLHEKPVAGKELSSAEALHLLSEPDAALRKEAAKSIGAVFGANTRIFALITNTLAKDKEIEDRWRGFKRPISSRNLGNFVEDEVVDALIAAVREAFPALSHRYYRLKAKWFGVEALPYWDRNAPLPDEDERSFTWDEARRTVLEAYAAFSPDMAAVGKRFFDNRWIDAPVKPSKAPGAFAHPTVPSVHPYLLLNYMGKARDVMTLAHELGHGVHQVLAGPQGTLMSDTPLTLAETASVFGEMLTFQAMLKAETDAKRRKAMLAAKVEDMINTVVRQIAFVEFEIRLHDARHNGELTAEQIGDIWMSVQGESLGPAIRFEDEYRCYWTYIPHFIHTPFYVYAYAFGDCLVNSLYAVYQGAQQGFAEKYLDMLKAGGTRRHKELLAPFGLDASDPKFWRKGLSVIEGFIDQLEKLG